MLPPVLITALIIDWIHRSTKRDFDHNRVFIGEEPNFWQMHFQGIVDNDHARSECAPVMTQGEIALETGTNCLHRYIPRIFRGSFVAQIPTIVRLPAFFGERAWPTL